MEREALIILPPELAPVTGPERLHATPYGAVTERDGVLLRPEGVDARALIYAAKDSGARRVVAGESVQAISPMLEQGDLVVPGDIIDQTRLRPFTFFVGKGYGFIKLNPPFCPDLMATLLVSARSASPRAFQRAVYIGAEGPRDATPAELRMFRQWGGDIVGSGLLPEAYLARELELCYAALTAVGAADLLPILRAAAAQDKQQDCTCGETMAYMKSQGFVGEDWRTW